MDRVDRLIIKAQKALGVKQIVHALIDRISDGWEAKAYIQDAKAGNQLTVERSTHSSMDAAVSAIHELAEQYPNSRDLVILVDDI